MRDIIQPVPVTDTHTLAIQLRDRLAGADDADRAAILHGVIWPAWGAGRLTDAEAANLEQLAGRGDPVVAEPAAPSRPRPVARLRRPRSSCSTGKPRTRSPDHIKSAVRRLRTLRRCELPDEIAAKHGIREHRRAVLTIIGELCGDGAEAIPVGKIAALAAVAERTVQRAIAHAVRVGLIAVIYRPRRGRPHGFSIIRIVCADWLARLRTRSLGSGRVTGWRASKTHLFSKGVEKAIETAKALIGGPEPSASCEYGLVTGAIGPP